MDGDGTVGVKKIKEVKRFLFGNWAQLIFKLRQKCVYSIKNVSLVFPTSSGLNFTHQPTRFIAKSFKKITF